MFIAKDEKGNLVEIDEARRDRMYYCPCCGTELIQKRGDIKVHHFSHKNLNECDSFYEPMTKWHLDWQRRFPKQCREVVVRHNGETHRADVLLRNQKIVLEFQHSPISSTEIRRRNKFYTEAGYEIIWVFDKGAGTLQDIVNIVNYGEYNLKGKIHLMKDYTDMVVYDFGKFCHIASDFGDMKSGFGDVNFSVSNMLCSADSLYDVLTHVHYNGGIEKLCQTLEFNRKYGYFMQSLVLSYIDSSTKDFKSVSKLFGMVGEYIVESTQDEYYLNAYWRNPHVKDNRYTTRYLANAISDNDKLRIDHLRDSIRYNNEYYAVRRVTISMVLAEIGEKYT